MGQDFTEFRVSKGKEVKISFPNPAQVAAIAVNGQEINAPAGSFVVSPPAAKKFSSLNVTLNQARQTRPVEVQIETGIGRFHHFILPELDLARFHFIYESEQKLVYCAVEDDYVIAGPNGRCPNHP